MKLRKCIEHGYTLKLLCTNCKKATHEGHYKFKGLKNAKEALVV